MTTRTWLVVQVYRVGCFTAEETDRGLVIEYMLGRVTAAMEHADNRCVILREVLENPPPGPQNPPNAGILMRLDRDSGGVWRWSRATRYVA